MSQIANLSNAAANAQASALATLCNNGFIEIYSGPQPVNANTGVTGSNTLLATLGFSATAFAAPVAGLLTANAISSGTAAASGTATFARLYQSDGVTVVMDVQVSIAGGGGAIQLNTPNIVASNPVALSSLTYQVPLT